MSSFGNRFSSIKFLAKEKMIILFFYLLTCLAKNMQKYIEKAPSWNSYVFKRLI